ncbi:hypothetical protein AwDysgo_21130 [Bacteroidales bacterium]|nr:hypothetical protein AwDysgo_21130 [Bacteroidales bacterium]
MHSYHIFYFPFKWEFPNKKDKLFSEQTKLSSIPTDKFSNWERTPEISKDTEANELYNEKNYFYEFVHPLLYDTNEEDSLVFHYERKETKTGDVRYIFNVRDKKEYNLKVDAINLNLYSTGVGVLSFYLENHTYEDKEDILTINQYGRRIFPPFIGDVENRYEIAEFIAIENLGGSKNYKEDFTKYTNKDAWKPASFIDDLISDLSSEINIIPVIDDRMFVNCWYPNDDLSLKYKDKDELPFNAYLGKDEFLYKYIYVDVSSITCKNDRMMSDILQEQTYKRWQKDGTLFGMSRYSFVTLTNHEFYGTILGPHMRTIYSRMIEMVLVTKASILKFSMEVTEVSKLSKKDPANKELVDRIASLYREYIHFINQFYFNEITIQDQGIELYNLMKKTLNISDYVKSLGEEIEELHRYVVLLEDRERNKRASALNLIATIFVPASLTAALFGMNWANVGNCFWTMIAFVVILGIIGSLLILCLTKKNK